MYEVKLNESVTITIPIELAGGLIDLAMRCGGDSELRNMLRVLQQELELKGVERVTFSSYFCESK